jgi:ABC-type antimicrobial peptide transport system permease subunit
MIKHILKILWNQKRDYYGIFIEQFLVTIILILSVVSVSESIKKYRSPGLLDVENTFTIGYMFGEGVQPEIRERTEQSMDVIIENLKKLPCVKAVTRSFNLAPYLKNDRLYASQFSDSIHIDDKHFLTVLKISDEYGASVLNPDLEEGTWLENHALPDGSVPVVITRQFANKAGWTNTIGKKITVGANTCIVVGVVAGLKQEPFVPSPVAMVIPQYVNLDKGMYSETMVKIRAGTEREFIEAYNQEFTRLISDANVELLVSNMQSLKRVWMSFTLSNVVLQSIPTLFLFIFAFIGTSGLFWMVSQKRMKEFALRIALGSTKSRLMRIVIGESLLITCIAIFPALLLSFFIYEYTVVHAIAVSAIVCIMLLFAIVSAWYPAWKVSRINPAEALQYE